MRTLQLLAGVFALTFASVVTHAQDAQEIIKMSARLYADTQSYSGEVDSRLIQLVFTPTGGGKFSTPEVNGTQYRRLQLKVRRPYGYWLSVQVYMDGAVANSPVSSSVVARADDKLPKQGIITGGAIVMRDMPAEQFNAAANSRLGDRASEDVVLRYLQATGAVTDNEHPLGLLEPDLIGTEALGTLKVYRIVAKTTRGEPITLWIDKESLLIVRSIVQRIYPLAASTANPAPVATAATPDATTPPAAELRKVVVCETLYRKQQLAPTWLPTDFAIGAGPGNERPTPEVLGFTPVIDMVKLAEIVPVN